MSKWNSVLHAQRKAALDGVAGVEPLPPPATQNARSRGAELANAADAAFMMWCRDQHYLARSAGILWRIRHVGPPVRFIGPNLCEPIGKGPADFQGQLARRFGALPVVAEAKTREGRLALSEIPTHQRADLDECADDGGISVLLYEHRDGLLVTPFAIPWRAVPWRSVRKGAGPSIGPEECAPWRVRALYWQELIEVHHVIQG